MPASGPTRRQLLVGGTADPFWDVGVAAALGRDDGSCEIHEVPGADDALEVAGRVTDICVRLGEFVGSLPSSPP